MLLVLLEVLELAELLRAPPPPPPPPLLLATGILVSTVIVVVPDTFPAVSVAKISTV